MISKIADSKISVFFLTVINNKRPTHHASPLGQQYRTVPPPAFAAPFEYNVPIHLQFDHSAALSLHSTSLIHHTCKMTLMVALAKHTPMHAPMQPINHPPTQYNKSVMYK